MANTIAPTEAALNAASSNNAPREIPDEDVVQFVATGGTSWRFAKGQIVTGREADGTLQSRRIIVGRILRVGIHKGETNDQYRKPYEQLEADIQTKKGMVYLKASLIDDQFQFKVNRAALDFAWGLLQIKDSETDVAITAAQGEAWTDNMGRPMSPSTYVNFGLVGEDNQARPLRKPKKDPNGPKVSMNDQFNHLRWDLEQHPLWAPRPAGQSRDDEDEDSTASGTETQFQLLSKESLAKGWPSPEQAPTEWLAMVAAAVGENPRATLTDYDDAGWGWVREQVQGLVEIPGMLAPAKQRIDAASRPAARPAPTPAPQPASTRPAPQPAAAQTAPVQQAAATPAQAPKPAPAPAPASPFGASYPAGHPGNGPKPGEPGYVDPFKDE